MKKEDLLLILEGVAQIVQADKDGSYNPQIGQILRRTADAIWASNEENKLIIKLKEKFGHGDVDISKKIEMIRIVRDELLWQLKDSKDFVEKNFRFTNSQIGKF